MAGIIAGVDEAGRGALVGPLVIAGVSIEEGGEAELRRLRVRDSKDVAPRRRKLLAARIEKLAKDVMVLKIGACKIDEYRKQGVNLNRLEGMKMADVLDYLKADKAYVDAPDANARKFRDFLHKLMKSKSELVVEHGADGRYPICSAASIIAKVERDREVDEMRKKYGVKGSGYSSDPRTIEWVKEWLETHKELPENVRKTWATSGNLTGDKEQSRLSKWLRKVSKSSK